MNEKLLSVIVPVYNKEAYLDRCVSALTGQSYSNTEILLIDDGSTDGSGKICDDWAEKDSRVKVFHIPNGNLNPAREYGYKHSRGSYVAFMDADDCIAENYYRSLIDAMEKTDSDMAISGIEKVSTDGNRRVYVEFSSQSVEGSENIIRFAIEHGGTLWNMVMEKQLLDGVYFIPTRFGEDSVVAMQLCLKAKRLAAVGNLFYEYYIDLPGSITNESHYSAVSYRQNIDNQIYIFELLHSVSPQLEITLARDLCGRCLSVLECMKRKRPEGYKELVAYCDTVIRKYYPIVTKAGGHSKVIGLYMFSPALACFVSGLLTRLRDARNSA